MLMESAFGLAGRTHESNNYNATVIKTPYLREAIGPAAALLSTFKITNCIVRGTFSCM